VSLIVDDFPAVVITRHDEVGDVPKWIEMSPITLPELSKPSMAFRRLRKTKMLETMF